MNAALELIRTVEAMVVSSGSMGYLVIEPKNAGEPLIDELRQHKSEIIDLLLLLGQAA